MKDIYDLTLEATLELLAAHSWPEQMDLFRQVAAHQPSAWTLPLSACEAVGGQPEQSIPGVAAIACLQTGIILIDDMLDVDPRGEYQQIGAPAAANLASSFQSVGLEIVARCDAPLAARFAACASLNQMILTIAFGQYLDTQNPADEMGYWQVVKNKSAPFFGAALQIGALLGGASAEVAEQIRQLGCFYGEMVQIHDDLNDCMKTPANTDWTLGRSPLPILFAQVVDHPDRARFLELRQDIPDPEALAEAQTILIRCGAISYGIHHLLARYRVAQEMLQTMALPNQAELDTLFQKQIEPVEALFTTIEGTAACNSTNLPR